jgi:hypothetical protein
MGATLLEKLCRFLVMKQARQETEEELVVPNPKKQKRGDVEESGQETSEIFADPTLDVTFKMLFGMINTKMY